MSALEGLRDDVYRRPLATALDRLGLSSGWRCVDVGAGGGDVSVALAEIVGRTGRIYAVDADPLARDEAARAAAEHSQVLALTQAGEDLVLPEPVDVAFCRFLLLHVVDPAVGAPPDGRPSSARRMGRRPRACHLSRAGRWRAAVDARRALHPDVGAILPALAPRRRARPGRCLGGGSRRRRARSGHRVLGVADRRRSRGRSGGAAPSGHRDRPATDHQSR